MALALALSLPAQAGPPGFSLVDVAAQSGVTAVTVCGAPDKPAILDGTGPGLAILDYDGDGLQDIYLVNGGVTYDLGAVHAANVLYRNRGGGRFEDVTARAGVGDRHFGHGANAADLDGDGDVDLFVTNYGRNTYYRNRGDGTFEDATEEAGLGDESWSTGAAFADADGDGDLDLYVANYVGFDARTTPRLGNSRCVFMGVSVFCGPRGLTPVQDRYYRNRGDGTFEDATAAAGLQRPEPYYGLGVIFGDIDQDGDPDLYVADDATPNLLYLNRGDGTFVEEGLLRGVAVSQEGTEQAGMGASLGDYDGDGRVDLVVTNFSHDTHTLYRNAGAMFEVTTFRAGLGPPTLPKLGWGVGLVDLDGDGWKDLFFAHGHVYPQMDGRGLGTSYRQQNQVLRNLGNGRFEDVTAAAGPGLAVVESSRGAAFGDLDGDGDPDVVVVNLDAAPTLLRNDRSAATTWVGLVTHGRGHNPDAIGALVTARTGDLRQTAEVRAGSGYLSRDDQRILFGLGASAAPEVIEIRWRDGARERHRGLHGSYYHHLRQASPRREAGER